MKRKQNKLTIFAAADTKYFFEHGIPFAKSCIKNNHFCRIIIFYNLEEDLKEQKKSIINFLTNEFYKDGISDRNTLVTIIPENLIDLFVKSKLPNENRALYTSLRFYFALDVLKYESYFRDHSILITDIDCIINKEIFIDKEYDVGLFFRNDEDNQYRNDWERMGMKIAAGAVYLSKNNSEKFINDLHDFLNSLPTIWFYDQVALFGAYDKNKNLNYFKFDNTYLDWTFVDKNSYIYTGKGQRKNTDENYLKIKQYYKELKL